MNISYDRYNCDCQRARLRLIQRHPLFGVAITFCRYVFSPSLARGTLSFLVYTYSLVKNKFCDDSCRFKCIYSFLWFIFFGVWLFKIQLT